MKILNKVSVKSLKLNKKRTISTVIGIILSVALICAVATMSTSFIETILQEEINSTGYYHLKLYNVTNENFKQLQSNRDIKDLYSIYENGYAKLENIENENKPYLKLCSMEKSTFEYLKFRLIEGRFPNNNNEIIINKQILRNEKIDYKVGDKININIGQRKTIDNKQLYPQDEYNKENEQLTDLKNSEFTIVGIMERPNTAHESYTDAGYTVITTNNNIGKMNTYISLKNPKEYEKDIAEILGVSDLKNIKQKTDNVKYDEYNINEGLLRWEVFVFSDTTINMLYCVVAVVVFIIVFTSIFCIRNSFAIATSEKIKMYGMLSSVGATKKQIKKNVIFEGMLIGVIGIPLGILSGIIACIILIKIVNMIIAKYLFEYVDGMNIKISAISILMSIILGIITIYLSAVSSARKASKVSPIENLRNSNDIKVKSRKLKVPKIIEKIFKTGGVLAYKNLKRSQKKYRTTVISIAVSVCIFISMNGLLKYAFGITDFYYTNYDYNITIFGSSELLEEKKDSIVSLEGVEEAIINYDNSNYIRIGDKSKINLQDRTLGPSFYYDEQKEETIYTNEGDVAHLMILALDNKSFEKYAKKIGVNAEDIKTKGILCDKYYNIENGKTIEKRRYKYEKGDTITGNFKDKETSVKIGAITGIDPYGKEQSHYEDGYLVLNIDEFKNMNFKIGAIHIQAENTENLVKEIEKISDELSVIDLQEEVKVQKSMILIINIFLYGFIAVITLIGITNIFNTITSNMELRQKEFAMLKSIGMTKKEFNRMIRLETIFYGTKSLIYGITLGILGIFALYKAFSEKVQTTIYIPINTIIISIIGVFILIFIIMKYSINKINKQNTIETIRKENI